MLTSNSNTRGIDIASLIRPFYHGKMDMNSIPQGQKGIDQIDESKEKPKEELVTIKNKEIKVVDKKLKSYKNYLSKLPWIDIKAPATDKPILFDLKSNIFQEILIYINEEKDLHDFIIDFYSDRYISIIQERVEKKYKELIKSSFNVIIIGNRTFDDDRKEKPAIGNILSIDNLMTKRKKINTYIIENHINVNIKGGYYVEPSENELYDSSIAINFLDGYPLTSFFDCMLYGKECIYKYQDGVWKCRYRSDAAKMLKTTDKEMLDLCICYGFKYYHNDDRKNIIDKYENKKEKAIEAIKGSEFEKIYYLLTKRIE